ncbi:LysR family transcriptional regulator [Marinomonas sp. THO17]|uniref:LysR family transcriptional regulator n=1 Tax=Marinomonas sp. THO17 TaxID=3149048 RepID=UPI00336BBC3A
MNLKRLDLGVLVVLDALFKEGSVSQAATRLSISQPSVSYSLKKLREALNDELFVRAGNRMLPTAKALELEEPLRNLLSILQNDIIQESHFNPKIDQRRFIINTGDVGEVAFMPKLLSWISREAPGITIECAYAKTVQLPQALEDREIDLAIGNMAGLDNPNIHRTQLFEHPFVCAVSDSHPFIRDTLNIDLFRQAKHVGLAGEGYSQEIFEAEIIKQAGVRDVVFRTKHFMHLPQIVRGTDLVATLPKIAVAAQQNTSGLRIFTPPFSLTKVPVAMYWHHRYHRDAGLCWLRQLVMELFAEKDPTNDFEISIQE